MWNKKKKSTIKVTRFSSLSSHWYVMGYRPQDDSLKGRLKRRFKRLWRRVFGGQKNDENLSYTIPPDAKLTVKPRYAAGIETYEDLWK